MKNRIIPSIIISFACTLVVIFGIKCYNIYNIDKIVNQEVVENKDLYEQWQFHAYGSINEQQDFEDDIPLMTSGR